MTQFVEAGGRALQLLGGGGGGAVQATAGTAGRILGKQKTKNKNNLMMVGQPNVSYFGNI